LTPGLRLLSHPRLSNVAFVPSQGRRADLRPANGGRMAGNSSNWWAIMGDVADLSEILLAAGVRPGDLVGLSAAADGTLSVSATTGESAADAADAAERQVSPDEVAGADRDVRPRWVMWSQETAQLLTRHGVRLATCWDLAAVHRLLFGGWRAEPAFAWASLHGEPPPELPAGEPDLFSAAQDTPALGAAEGLAAARMQLARLAADGGGNRVSTARSESTAELLCAELAADGLPVDRAVAEDMLAGIIGPRPRGPAEAAAIRAARDERVLRHSLSTTAIDLRSPAQVKAFLALEGIDVPDTRAYRLEEFKDRSPLVAALLEWRKAERIATTYGYGWLDECLGADGRLRGTWTGSDGAAGRMTASSGLHNMPAVLRRAVLAEDRHLLVRADLGQIEPRVLAAVSGDSDLAAATRADDMYLPVAAELGVDRPTAKVAMIAAMYGQTTGHGGEAARRMRSAYPVAMGYLDAADRSGRSHRDLRTYGGRLIRMSGGGNDGARGRYGRNAVIQGAAAELFKMWAVTVRARTGPLDARIVLCLHDELLLHVPAGNAERTAELVGACLNEAAGRWAPGGRVRFIADITVVRCWADAKS
jgi:DNA polymerase I